MVMRRWFLALVAMVIGASAVPAAASIPVPGQAGSFVFTGWDGPPLPVFYQLPEPLTADTQIVFVMHGVNRDADRYRDTRSHSHATGHSRPIHACARGRVGRQPNARSSGTPFFTLGHCSPGNVRVAYFHRLSGSSGHHLSALAVGQERVICTTELLSAG